MAKRTYGTDRLRHFEATYDDAEPSPAKRSHGQLVLDVAQLGGRVQDTPGRRVRPCVGYSVGLTCRTAWRAAGLPSWVGRDLGRAGETTCVHTTESDRIACCISGSHPGLGGDIVA